MKNDRNQPRRKWRELCGIVDYPCLGEDAQVWISRNREEDEKGRGNYTEERRQMFDDVSLEDIVSEIKKMRNEEKEKTDKIKGSGNGYKKDNNL